MFSINATLKSPPDNSIGIIAFRISGRWGGSIVVTDRDDSLGFGVERVEEITPKRVRISGSAHSHYGDAEGFIDIDTAKMQANWEIIAKTTDGNTYTETSGGFVDVKGYISIL